MELKNFIEYCSKEKELYLQRKEWEDKFYALSTSEERNAFKEEFPKPEIDWGISDYREHLFRAIIFLNKFIKDIPDTSYKSIFEDEDKEQHTEPISENKE